MFLTKLKLTLAAVLIAFALDRGHSQRAGPTGRWIRSKVGGRSFRNREGRISHVRRATAALPMRRISSSSRAA